MQNVVSLQMYRCTVDCPNFAMQKLYTDNPCLVSPEKLWMSVVKGLLVKHSRM